MKLFLVGRKIILDDFLIKSKIFAVFSYTVDTVIRASGLVDFVILNKFVGEWMIVGKTIL